MPKIGWRQVADALRDQIIDGVLAPGIPLPSEVKLAQIFGCSRDTIRDAIAVLDREGQVIKRHGHLTIVRPRPDRKLVTVSPGAVITVRPITLPEAERCKCGPGVAILDVHSGDEHTLYRSDRYALIIETAGHPEGDRPL